MATKRIDGARAPNSLIERINTGDGLGEGLAQRTKEDYARKIGIIETKIKNLGQVQMTPSNLAGYIQHAVEQKKIAQSTARAIKAAAIFWIAEEAQLALAQGKSISEYAEAYAAIRELSTRELPQGTEKTSSKKLKYLSQHTLLALEEFAKTAPRTRHIGPLVAFLRANLLVGLRPIEWFNTEFIHYLHVDGTGKYIRTSTGQLLKTLALRVRNAKSTHGRSNGEYREILLHEISDADLATLMHFHAIAKSFLSKFAATTPITKIAQDFYTPIQNAMKNAMKRISPTENRATIYSSRHQAVANAKNSGLTDKEIAAMFGHGSTETSKRHYGKKQNGWRKVTFRPSPESIAGVPSTKTNRDIAMPDQTVREAAAEWNRSPRLPSQ